MRDIRFDVTQKCNLDCIYCHHEGMSNYNEELLSPLDYEFLSDTFTKTTGINSYTITGGEPLTRVDLIDILKLLKKDERKITLITNGILLEKKIEVCNYLNEIHVSIPSLSPAIYSRITQHNSSYLSKVKYGIEKVRNDFPSTNIGINTCIVKNVNDTVENLNEIIDFCKEYNLEPRLIQVMLYEELYKPLEIIAKQYGMKKLREDNRITIYEVDEINVKFIKCTCDHAISEPDSSRFCNETVDLSITPSGELKLCFLKDETVDLLPEIKDRNTKSLSNKIKLGINNVGKNCPLVKR